MDDPEGFAEWVNEVPEVMRADPLWRLAAYRYALFLGDLLQKDGDRLRRDVRTRALADQLIRAAHSISTNIAEGYGRTTGPERAKFFEYALGSARETRDWLFKARMVLGAPLANERILLVTRVMRILVASIPGERAAQLTRARRAEQAR